MTDSNNTSYPWIRQLRVTFDGLSGSQQRKVYLSDGSQNNLRIGVQIEKTLAEMPAYVYISIYNLAPESRDIFQRNETTALIEAGWQNQEYTALFKGNVLTATSQRSGPDIVTIVQAAAAHEVLITTPVHQTWRNVPVEAVVRQLASRLDGVGISIIKDIPGHIGKRGYTVAGTIGNILNGLARQYGFSWTVDGHGFRAIGDRASGSRLVTIQDPNLISSTPHLASAQQWRRGITVRCVLFPSIQPGDAFTVKSQLSSLNSGDFIANKITHHLDPFEEMSYYTTILGYSRSAEAV